MDAEFEQDLAKVYEEVKKRLGELGIEAQLPSFGVIRIIIETSMMVFGVEDETDSEDEGIGYGGIATPDDIRIGIDAVNLGGWTQESLVAFVDKAKFIQLLGIIDRVEGALYIRGHRVTVDFSGKVISVHADGSPCVVPCARCGPEDKSDVYVVHEAGEAYAVCRSCQHSTDLYPDKYQALGAWVVGKVTKEASL